ncbi:MAG: GntR family transcriptional regulator [Firmicutes bacterium]|nr:GntR family transcriptional regulator [Bacillota bacterium]
MSSHPLKSDSTEPLYQQIVSQIKAKIMDHSLPPGTKLPSEREMAEVARVSTLPAHQRLHLPHHIRHVRLYNT